MPLKMLLDKVLVKPDEEERTAGGIVLPDTAQEKTNTGRVIAVGPGSYDDKGNLQPLELKVGDRVVFAKFSGTELEDNGHKYLVLKIGDILAKELR